MLLAFSAQYQDIRHPSCMMYVYQRSFYLRNTGSVPTEKNYIDKVYIYKTWTSLQVNSDYQENDVNIDITYLKASEAVKMLKETQRSEPGIWDQFFPEYLLILEEVTEKQY